MKIALIGTCRIHDPLQNFWSDESYEILNADRPSLTHTSSEAIQRIKHYSGDYEYPEKLFNYQTKTNSTKLIKEVDKGEIDIFLVEISSRKLLQYKEHYLQWNNFTSQIKIDLGDEHANEWLRRMHALFKGEGGEVIGSEMFDYPSNVSAEKVEVLSSIEAKIQDYRKLEEEMNEIHRLTEGKVIFVTHINVNGNNGNPIESRKETINYIEDICNKNNLFFIDPTEQLLDINQENLMNKSGMDSNHYNNNALDKVGKFLLRKIELLHSIM